MLDTSGKPVSLNRSTLSPALRELIDENRRNFERQREAFHAASRAVIEALRARWAKEFDVNPNAFAEFSDDLIKQIINTSEDMKALADVPGAKMNVNFTCAVTVNGVPVPDVNE